jgi:cell division septation protein DedD
LNNTTDIARKLFESRHPFYVKDVGFFAPVYFPASLKNNGTEIRPPRYGWHFSAGEFEQGGHEVLEVEDSFAALVKQGTHSSDSFEVPGIGLFFYRDNKYEVLSKGALAQQQFGLSPIALRPVVVKSPLVAVPSIPKKRKNQLLILQATAAVLLVLLINIVVITVLTENGKLSFGRIAQNASIDENVMEAGLIDVDVFTGASYLPDHAMLHESFTVASTESVIIGVSPMMIPELDVSALSEQIAEQPNPIDTLQDGIVVNESLELTSKENDLPDLAHPVMGKRKQWLQWNVTSKQFEAEVSMITAIISNSGTNAAAEKEETTKKTLERQLPTNSSNDNTEARSQISSNLSNTGGASAGRASANSPKEGAKVVVGAFKLRSNAEAYVNDLKKRGFDAYVIENERSALVRVVVSDAEDQGDEGFLLTIKSKINKEAWILE